MTESNGGPDWVRDVRRVGRWAVGQTPQGTDFAVSRRCRHQLADLSAGTVDADGCLVCPWHQSRYDVQTGAMVTGPHGFLGFHAPTPRYGRLVLAYGRRLRLAVGQVVMRDGHIDVKPRR